MTNIKLEFEDIRDIEAKNYYKLLVEDKKKYTKSEFMEILNKVGRD